jgi:hypothetical protein
VDRSPPEQELWSSSRVVAACLEGARFGRRRRTCLRKRCAQSVGASDIDVVSSCGSAAYVDHGAVGDVFLCFAEHFPGDRSGFPLAEQDVPQEVRQRVAL